VNSQATLLEQWVDPTQTPHVTKANKVLWTEFEAAFQSAWKDTAKTQSTYDQLMKLQMKDLEVNTYNAMFERLAAMAKWEPDAKGTIAQYHASLRENIHWQIVNQENLPTMMDKWKIAAQKEVGWIKELQSAVLIGPHQNQPHDQHAYQSNQCTHLNLSNNQHIPMDVDSANISVPFCKLTNKEHTKYHAEGRCFCCRTQGHMAHNCPKNSNSTNLNCSNTNACKSTMTTATIASIAPVTPASVLPPVPPKLSLAQQIRALEEKMMDEEHGNYLNACNMGEDFCSAGY
jgi:hypothetical protein